MQFKVIEDHKCNNRKPLTIEKGTKVKVGRGSDGEEWASWIYCYSIDGASEGWTPKQIIKIECEHGIVLEDYSAKELEVKKGKIVEGIVELNGWLWCHILNGTEEGWLPKEKLLLV